MEEKKEMTPIDFTIIVKTLWQNRKKFYYVLPATLIITYLILLCIPRYYKCEVSLAPETDGTSVSGSIESLASSFGLGSLAKLNSSDAIYAEIYPEVVASKNFIAELMTIDIKTKEGDIKCNYYTYMRDYQKSAWWNIIKESFKGLFSEKKPDNYNGKEKISTFDLTKLQTDIFTNVQGKIKCRYDKTTDIVSIIVKDQDPLVCATMAEATCVKLQEFITKYRTNKARIDYEYYNSLCDEAKKDYEKALQKYASSSDAHKNTVLATYQAKIESLENDMQAKYSIYTAMSTQKQAAAAKLQEATPAFTVIESASVPVKPAGPKRMIISIAVMILAFFIQSAIILAKKK